MMRRGKQLAAFLVLALLLLTGCGEKKNAQTEITLIHGWGSSEPDHVAMRRIYKDFELAHPGVRINLVSMPSADDVIRKVQEMLTVGEVPDVVFTAGAGEELLYEFMVEKGFALDLMPYLEADPDFRGTVSETAISRWRTEDNRLFTVSDVLLLSGYWYNADLFEAAGIRDLPMTWDDWILACERIGRWSDGMGNDAVSIVLDEECLLYLTDAILASYDADALQALAQGTLEPDDKKLRPMMETLKRICECAEVEEGFTYRDTLERFNAGESAMYVNGVWAGAMISGNLNVKYAAFPSGDGTGISCISSCVGYLLGDTGNPERQDASAAFLKYMLSDATQERILRETGQVVSSPRTDIASLSGDARLLQAVTCVQQAGHVMEVPENIWKSAARVHYLKYLEEALQNIDPE